MYAIIKHIYPDIQDSEFALQDDGNGPYIKRWNYAQPQPTQAEMDAAAPTVAFNVTVKQFDVAVEAHLHAEATAHGYTNIERACMYASYANPYQAESQTYVAWVGNVWAYCYAELEKVKAGTRPMPTIEEIIAELPARVVPA